MIVLKQSYTIQASKIGLIELPFGITEEFLKDKNGYLNSKNKNMQRKPDPSNVSRKCALKHNGLQPDDIISQTALDLDYWDF